METSNELDTSKMSDAEAKLLAAGDPWAAMLAALLKPEGNEHA